ncbi:MAG: glycosyltransferase [Ornithinimicrobium sp.]
MAEDRRLVHSGRRARVALLVYNDAHNDSRVLKTAATLRSAGAQVRIFAVARGRAGYAEGLALVGDGIDVQRAPEFELVRYAPWVLSVARRLTGRPIPPSPLGASTAAGPAEAPVVEPAGPPTSGWNGAARRWLNDVWLRSYRVVSLGLYWVESARAAAAWEPDIVHANDGNTLAPARWVARACGAQIVYDAHELWRHRNVRTDRPVAPWIEAAIESRVISRAAGVITVSPSIATWLQETYDLPVRPTLVRNIPRGVDEVRGSSGDIDPDPSQGRLRQMAGLAPQVQVVAYGGRITTSRGIEETLDALALLPLSVHFVLLGYGEPDYLATLRTRIDALGVKDRVHFVGAVASDQVSTALADADLSVVFVRPICLSYAFSLPNKLFESIHAGLPIAAADLPDTAAIVREYGVGEIFEVDDPSQIATAMASTMAAVLADPQRYRQAARVAAGVLTWQHEERALLSLYAQVLDR